MGRLSLLPPLPCRTGPADLEPGLDAILMKQMLAGQLKGIVTLCELVLAHTTLWVVRWERVIKVCHQAEQ